MRPNWLSIEKLSIGNRPAGLQMDNVLEDMVQRLRAIQLLLRTQNELLTTVLTELEQIRRCVNASRENCSRVVPPVPTEPSQHG